MAASHPGSSVELVVGENTNHRSTPSFNTFSNQSEGLLRRNQEPGTILTNYPIILFDGVCNLCNRSVQFIIRHDPQSKFRFAALQSDFGVAQLQEFRIPSGKMNSIILIKGGRLYQKSNSALEIARNLSGLWPALYVFKAVPRFLRDWIYDLIARNRYRLFGKREACMIPTPELKSRFIG